MKKKWATLGLALFCGLNATLIVGCDKNNSTHTHENKFYTVKQATCTGEGLMEVVCSICGEKSYQEIQPVGHEMANGVCTVCGYNGNTPAWTPVDSTDFSAFYTYDDLYEKAKSTNFFPTEDLFYEQMYNLTLTNVYVNSLGDIKVGVNGVHFNIGAVQKEYIPSKQSVDEYIRAITIEQGRMQVTLASGSLINVGYISSDAKSVDDQTKELLNKGYSMEYITYFLMYNSPYVIGITVNKSNQVFVRMGDNRIVSIGKISEYQTETSDSALVYQEVEGGYEIIGCMDNAVESITIPPTHLGRNIVGIGQWAFNGCKKLKEVNIMSGVTNIGRYAFFNCESLTEVTIPDSVTVIEDFAFKACDSLASVIFTDVNGWSTGNDNALSADTLSNSATAAEYLTSTYINVYWTKSK